MRGFLARQKRQTPMSHISDIIKIQRWAGTVPDGNFGPVSAQAVVQKLGLETQPNEEPEWHSGKGSSFADPADVRAFRRCKAEGKNDQQCFKVGDNGVGCWNDDTSEGSGPSCAIPPDDMEAKFGSVAGAKHAKVIVEAAGKTATVTVKDRMPWKRNITNGAVIDLNPDAAELLGLRPPFMVPVRWKWA